MRAFDFGAGQVAVTVHHDRSSHLTRFFADATEEVDGGDVDLLLHVVAGGVARLELDQNTRTATLVVPRAKLADESAATQVQIAVLQAAARCLDCVLPSDHLLLHGSASELGDGGRAVAVLDGGHGQGKTSLAFGLACAGGRLLVDEFTFLRFDQGGNVVFPAARLPWHIRGDMAPHLVPDRPDSRLLFPGELRGCVGCVDAAAELMAVLIPDGRRPAGSVTRVDMFAEVECYLRPALTDHRAKLLDPRLDHVSLFAGPDQITSVGGASMAHLGFRWEQRCSEALHAMREVPLFLVGIGTPADIGVSVQAARLALESL